MGAQRTDYTCCRRDDCRLKHKQLGDLMPRCPEGQAQPNLGYTVLNVRHHHAHEDRPAQYQLVLDTSEMAGTITVDLSQGNPGGTIVDVTLQLRSKGLLSSMFFPVVSRAIGGGLPDQVEAMAPQLSA